MIETPSLRTRLTVVTVGLAVLTIVGLDAFVYLSLRDELGDTRNEESNQLNLRGAYTLGADSSCSHEIGLSGQYGEIYNADTNRNGDHFTAEEMQQAAETDIGKKIDLAHSQEFRDIVGGIV